MPFTNYPYGVTSFGVPLTGGGTGSPYPVGFLGAGTTTTAGSNVYFVNSAVNGCNDNPAYGTSPYTPFKTLNYAVSKCIANNGDVIYVGAGHVETVATAGALTFGKAGVTVIGIGNRGDRPTINYTTSTAATVTVTAANVSISNFVIRNSIDARVDGFIVTGTGFVMTDCSFSDDTACSSLISLRTTNAAIGIKLTNIRCDFAENTGTARTEFIRIVGGTNHQFTNIYTDEVATFSTAVFNNVTTAMAGFLMQNCDWMNGTTAPGAVFVAGSIGSIRLCNFYTTAGVSAVTLPTSVAIDNDSSVSNGTYNGPANVGETFAFQKSIVSSTITTGGVVVLTCTGGSVEIENIVSETDSTGLAGGTNCNPTTNNAFGIAAVVTAGQLTFANLGANATVVWSSLTGWKTGFALENTKAMTLTATGSNGTGAGVMKLTVYGRVLTGAPVLS